MIRIIYLFAFIVMFFSGVYGRLDLVPEMKLPYGTNSLGLYTADFYPIGFSPQGHFAYVIYKDLTDGLGEYTDFRFIIQDLRSDKVVYDIRIDNSRGGNEPEAIPLEKLWLSFNSKIEENLKEYKIINSITKLSPLPYTHSSGAILNLKVHNIRLDENSLDYEFWKIRSYSVSAVNGMKKSKLIYENKAPRSLGVYPGGLILSPYEDRAAIIMIETFYGFEGSSDQIPLIIGCHLEKGFK